MDLNSLNTEYVMLMSTTASQMSTTFITKDKYYVL